MTATAPQTAFAQALDAYDRGQLEQAAAQFEQLVRQHPAWLDARTNLGTVLLDLGFAEHAARTLVEGTQRGPVNATYLSNLLLTLNYLPDLSPDAHFEWHRRFGQALEPHVPAMAARPRAGGIRRLGLVSGDLRTHPVGRLIEPLLPEWAALGVEVVCYSSRAALAGDPLPARLHARAFAWRDIEPHADGVVAQAIRDDGIDALIDLSGHTSHNRLGVFAARPAPLQASWLGYGATTGLTRMDVVLGDEVSNPPGDDARFVERLARLPVPRLPLSAPPDTPPPAPPPAVREGRITFGCFNNLAKINTAVLSTWARLLHLAPDSRLLLKGRHFNYQRPRVALIEAFRTLGISDERLLFEGFEGQDRYWDSFSRVDIALDPFPFSGGQSTLDALWMGVPVISLEAGGMFGRQGAMILRALGLDDWLATDRDAYVSVAARHAADIDALVALRPRIRELWAGSAPANPRAYAEAVLATLDREWQRA